MESIFGPAPVNPLNVEPSIINENWPRFKVVSDVNFTADSPLVPCIFSSVKIDPTAV